MLLLRGEYCAATFAASSAVCNAGSVSEVSRHLSSHVLYALRGVMDWVSPVGTPNARERVPEWDEKKVQ